MGVEQQVRSIVSGAIAGLVEAGSLPEVVRGAAFAVERPKRPEHGDVATNAALALQKLAGKPPREIATLLGARLAEHPSVRAVEIAGPGPPAGDDGSKAGRIGVSSLGSAGGCWPLSSV